jgi:hypothetical protein
VISLAVHVVVAQRLGKRTVRLNLQDLAVSA